MTKEVQNDLNDLLAPKIAKGDSGKFKRIKKALIIILPILLLVIVGAYFFLFVIRVPKTPETALISQGKQPLVLERNTYLDLDPVTVGLTQVGSKREYLKIDLTLRLGSAAESNAIMDKVPIIKDSLITLLKSLRASDFNSSSSIIYLKEEITKRINKIVAPIIIREVLFQELMVN